MKKIPLPWRGESIELSVRAVSRVGRLTRALEDGATLRSGDYLSFAVMVSHPAYVYVVQVHPESAGGAAGRREVIFPERGSEWLEAGEEKRIPESPYWYQLDDATGVENLFFVASARSLEQADRAVHEEVEAIRVSSAPKAPPPPASPPTEAKPQRPRTPPPEAVRTRPAPKATTLATRGLVKTAVAGDPTLRVESDADGIAILNFRIRHEGRKQP